ncbi:MAG TPA: glycosyltransferase family 87 protein, partial [Chloroflexota bacterium]
AQRRQLIAMRSWSIWRVGFGLACLGVLALGVFRQIAPRSYQGPDFIHTYDAALAMRLGQNPYTQALAWVEAYAPGAPLTDQHFYAPTFAILLTPLTFLPYQTALVVWGVCISVFLCVAIYALLCSGGSRPSLLVVLASITAASLMSAVRAEYFLGQANLFMLACICVAVWARQARLPGVAGVLLALALATKPMLLPVVILLLWKREFRFAAATLASFVSLVLGPFLWLGHQVLGDLLMLWHFYSTQYLSFRENIAPRGMLERLFSANPYVRPIVEAPLLATVMWLMIAVAIMIVMLAVISPRPFQRDNRSLLELGVMVSGLLLISPLTEPPYLVLLIIPLVASFSYLRAVAWTQAPFRLAVVALLVVWAVELLPRRYEDFFWDRIHTGSISADLFVSLAPGHFYILLATFALQLYVLGIASNTSFGVAVRNFTRHAPLLAQEWLTDALRALKPSAAALARRSSSEAA